VYTIKPNIGAATGTIRPCNQNLSDLSITPGLDITIKPKFNLVNKQYVVERINLIGFPAQCRGVEVGINVTLASDAQPFAEAIFECLATLPSNFTAPYTHSFLSLSSGSQCQKVSGWGDTNALDLGTVVASDLEKIYLIVSG
jgi:hypothetical protein